MSFHTPGEVRRFELGLRCCEDSSGSLACCAGGLGGALELGRLGAPDDLGVLTPQQHRVDEAHAEGIRRLAGQARRGWLARLHGDGPWRSQPTVMQRDGMGHVDDI